MMESGSSVAAGDGERDGDECLRFLLWVGAGDEGKGEGVPATQQ